MTSGKNSVPISPHGVPGPASSPTSDSLSTLASDPDLTMRAFAAGALAVQAGYDQAKPKSPKEFNWLILAYLSIVAMAIVIFFLPRTNEAHKNQALGFVFGQAPLILSKILKKSEKD
jgi:peptidoglycan/LPS O-acetylase OafA/YrhL